MPRSIRPAATRRAASRTPAPTRGPHPARLARRPARTRATSSSIAPTESGSKPSRWRRMPEARPADILKAALDAFVENGFAATRLEDVAQRAGVSKGTLYLYFENKEALFKAAVRENILPYLERAEHRFETFRGSSRDLLVE